MQIETSEGLVKVEFYQYPNNSLRVELIDADTYEPVATLSTNVDKVSQHLPYDCFVAKTYSENKKIAEECLASGLFEDTEKPVIIGFAQGSVWKVKNYNKEVYGIDHGN